MNDSSHADAGQKRLFWACFIALVATAFAFMLRIQVVNDPSVQAGFGLTETQKGEILGAGFWPFSISIVLFSLVIDRIGYGKSIAFAFIAHLACAVLMLTASGYWGLYLGSIVGGLAAGAVEAVINPLVASMFTREKTKWLNVLHAGWPGGLVLAGAVALLLAAGGMGWKGQMSLMFIPVVAYGVMMKSCKFPVSERVVAGVSYREMLQEAGFFGALLTSYLMFSEIGRVLGWGEGLVLGVVAVVSLAFGAYVRTLGRPIFIVLMIVMMPLAITELGVDSWIGDLMAPAMVDIGISAGWVLVYTSFLMMVLRFSAGPIVHRLQPLGLLAVSATLAILGLVALSSATGIMVLLAATLYALGKTFFWPTMLGVVSEQCPKGGALTLNMIGGIGMLSVGVVGNALLGNIQDKYLDHELAANHPALHERYIGEEKVSVFGAYNAPDSAAIEAAPPADAAVIGEIRTAGKKETLSTVAWFPGSMLVAYLLLILFFRSRGGYKPVELAADGH